MFRAGELAAQFIADCALVPVFPNAGNPNLIAQAGVAVGKRVLIKPVDRQGGLLRVRGRQRVLICMVRGSVFRQQLGCAVAGVVRMRKAVVDHERLLGLLFFPVGEVAHDLIAMPLAAALRRATAFRRIVANRECFVGRLVGIPFLAGADGLVSGVVENGGEGAAFYPLRNQLVGLFPAVGSGGAPECAACHDHCPRAGADRTGPPALLVRSIKYEPLPGDPVDVRRVES